jgi:hypothetical protein
MSSAKMITMLGNGELPEAEALQSENKYRMLAKNEIVTQDSFMIIKFNYEILKILGNSLSVKFSTRFLLLALSSPAAPP